MIDLAETKAFTGLKRAVQIGIVVRDLQRSTELLSSIFGIARRFVSGPIVRTRSIGFTASRRISKFGRPLFRPDRLNSSWFSRLKAHETPIANSWTPKAKGFIMFCLKLPTWIRRLTSLHIKA